MAHEKMYQCALQGYEKALSHEQVNTYIPAPNKAQKVTVLYEQIGRANETKDVYFRALYGLGTVLEHPRCQDIIAALAALQGGRR
jgi:hypothetical protein